VKSGDNADAVRRSREVEKKVKSESDELMMKTGKGGTAADLHIQSRDPDSESSHIYSAVHRRQNSANYQTYSCFAEDDGMLDGTSDTIVFCRSGRCVAVAAPKCHSTGGYAL